MFNFNFFNVRTQKIYSAQGKENPQNTIIQPNQNSVSAKEIKEEDIPSGYKDENKIPENSTKIWEFANIIWIVILIAIVYSGCIDNRESFFILFVQLVLFLIFQDFTSINLLTRLKNYNDSIEDQVQAITKSANECLKKRASISPTQQLDSYIHERDFIEGVLNQRVTFLVSLFAAFLAALVAFVSAETKDNNQSSLIIPLIALESVNFFAHLVFYFLCLATYRSYERIRFCIYACDILHRHYRAFNAGTVFKDYEKEKNAKEKTEKFNASVLHHIGITIPLLVFYASFVFSLLASAAIALSK